MLVLPKIHHQVFSNYFSYSLYSYSATPTWALQTRF